MPSGDFWEVFLDTVADLPSDAVLTAPLSRKRFSVTAVHKRHLCIEFQDDEDQISLQRDRFEILADRVTEATEGFDLDRLPPNADPYATVLSLHPRFDLDDSAWKLFETERPSPSPLVETAPDDDVSAELGTVSEPNEATGETAPSIEEMIDNMGNPDDVVCPIEGCQYSHRSAASVARHVSGSSTADHLWEHTSYRGWRDFVREHDGSPG